MEQNDEEAETTPPPTSAGGEVERLRAALAETERSLMDAEGRAQEEHHRAEGYVALLKRERADFTNYRRRVEQERVEQAEQATVDLMRALLPALYDLERALNNVPDELAGSPWVAGIRLIDRALRESLERAGLTRINTEGQPFDPQVHEALLQEDAPGRSEGEVVRELQPGYRLGERVLRPAQVSVARATPSSTQRHRGTKRRPPDRTH